MYIKTYLTSVYLLVHYISVINCVVNSHTHSFSVPATYNDCKDFSNLIKFRQEHLISGFLENAMANLHFSPSYYLSV
jgi:hypothetical protein